MKTQQAFVIDVAKCTGCQACEVACTVENQLEPGTSWRTVHTFNEPRYPGIPLFHLSLACNHCLDAPCMEHCPALAYSKDEKTGAVTIDPDKCMGCKYCTWACPYDAPRFDAEQGIVTKCTFCNHRQVEGLEPACVSQCPTGALQIAALDTAPGKAGIAGFPNTGVGPAVRFLPLRGERPYPEMSTPIPAAPAIAARKPPSKITLKSEWPLVVFTLLASILVGMVAADTGVNALTFALLSAAGMGLSTLHLGRKMRAWRSVLNWRRSWLSREIILFSMFAGLSVIYLLADEANPALHGLVTVIGLAALFAIDAVYWVTRTPRLRLHSAQTLLTAALVLGLLSGSGALFLGAGTVKLFLYVFRRLTRPRAGTRAAILGVLRIVAGLLLPMGLWLSTGFGLALVVGLVIGEVIDRCEFYMDLVVPTPHGQIAVDLATASRRLIL
jgi:Fe-S-cluster-containing dehydrogenase component